MTEKGKSKSAKQQKTKAQGGFRVVPESRARRETLELKEEIPGGLPATDEHVELGGSRSDRAAASRVGRQPVRESQHEHPAGKGPPMPRREALRERAAGATMKPGAAPPRAGIVDPTEDE